MATIDIELPAHLQEQLSDPVCIELPEVKPVSITLPSGGQLKAIADITKGIPDQCALNFNLMLQLGPLLANLECLIKVVNVIDKLKGIIDGLPAPSFDAISDFTKAVEELAPCIAMVAGVPAFVRDILCLVVKVLQCVVEQLQSVLAVMTGLSLQLQAAEGNPALTSVLQCAQDNAATSAAHAMGAVESVVGILGLVEPFMSMAGVAPLEMPTFETIAGGEEAIESMQATVDTLETFVSTIAQVADALGGC